jgi:ubiquinone/menaquinone biosynthesis C-methylase UbiE
MLPRVLEPEVMDTAEEARDYNAMDHSAVNRVFVSDFLAVWNGQGPILDVGTGTALIPIELCRKHATAEVLGIDLAEHMLAVGRENVRRAGLAERIRLERVSGRGMSFAKSSFAAVMSNSIIHHIPEPISCAAEIARVSAPGGTIFVRDLMRPPNMRTLELLVNSYATGANEHQRKMFAASLHAALTLDEIRDIMRQLGFEPLSVTATSDRHWTWSASKP